jgi:hypothetical protein
MAFDRDDDGRFNYSVSLLDKGGRRVQNIRSEFEFERPPIYIVADGAVVVTVESQVRVYR